jgi:hypothetical protein
VAIEPSGGTVDFTPGLQGPIILTSGQINISKNLTIDAAAAAGITVSGNNSQRVFNIPAATPMWEVIIKNLRIAQGYATGGDGNGILNAGKLTLTSSTVDSNRSPISQTGGNGGGIYSTGELTVSNSVVSNNYAPQDGGGIFVGTNSLLTVSMSRFIANSTSFALFSGGGAIFVQEGANVSVRGQNNTMSRFEDNQAFEGGAIYNSGGTIRLTGYVFALNFADFRGGAIGNDSTPSNGGNLIISNTTFSQNSVRGAGGGAIVNLFTGSQFARLNVGSSTFSDNSAYAGGAIENSGDLTVTNSTLSGNTATGLEPFQGGDGGAIVCGGTATITSSTITNNVTISYGTDINKRGEGGGIMGTSTPFQFNTCFLRNTIVGGNISDKGPDVYNTVHSNGHNLVGNTIDSDGWIGTDLLNLAPRLEPLAFTLGSPTETHRPCTGPTASPALNAGDNASAPAADQRGQTRIVPTGGTIDIGSVEIQTGEVVTCSSGSAAYGRQLAFHDFRPIILVSFDPTPAAPHKPFSASAVAHEFGNDLALTAFFSRDWYQTTPRQVNVFAHDCVRTPLTQWSDGSLGLSLQGFTPVFQPFGNIDREQIGV